MTKPRRKLKLHSRVRTHTVIARLAPRHQNVGGDEMLVSVSRFGETSAALAIAGRGGKRVAHVILTDYQALALAEVLLDVKPGSFTTQRRHIDTIDPEMC